MKALNATFLAAVLGLAVPLSAEPAQPAQPEGTNSLDAALSAAQAMARGVNQQLNAPPKQESPEDSEIARVEQARQAFHKGSVWLFSPLAPKGQRNALDELAAIFKTTKSESVQQRIVDALLCDAVNYVPRMTAVPQAAMKLSTDLYPFALSESVKTKLVQSLGALALAYSRDAKSQAFLAEVRDLRR